MSARCPVCTKADVNPRSCEVEKFAISAHYRLLKINRAPKSLQIRCRSCAQNRIADKLLWREQRRTPRRLRQRARSGSRIRANAILTKNRSAPEIRRNGRLPSSPTQAKNINYKSPQPPDLGWHLYFNASPGETLVPCTFPARGEYKSSPGSGNLYDL